MKKFYRPEIDGLRGICVLSVIFYHLEFPFFYGGFLGVDIFFLISGYLITKILLDKKINFLDFYERRARRILPALFFFLFVTTFVVYYFYLDTKILKDYALSLFSNILFISNFFFSQKINYFNNDNAFHPLLHTWSLSVEEQFYIIFPIIIFIFSKYKKKNMNYYFLFFILLNIIFIQLSGNLKKNYPFIEKDLLFFNQSYYFNFFLLSSRIWEFLMGALIYSCIKKRTERSLLLNYCLVPTGYLLIFYSFILITPDRSNPNIYTLIPLLGASIVMIYENKSTVTYKFITSRLLKFFGIISYSLYLYHHPIISIANYNNFNQNYNQKFLIFFILVFIAILSFIFIEKPFRNKDIINRDIFYKFITTLFFTNLFLSVYLYNDDAKSKYIYKLFSNYSFSKNLLDNNYLEKETLKRNSNNLDKIQNNKNNNNILVIGDSHGADFTMILRNNLFLTKNNNINFYNIETHHFTRNNLDDLVRVNNFFKSSLFIEADTILIADAMYPYRISKDLKNDLDGIKFLNNQLKNNKKIILINQSPYFFGSHNPVKTIILRKGRNSFLSDNYISNEIYKLIPNNFFELNKKIEKISKEENIQIFDVFSIFCDNDKKICKFKDNKNNLLFFDSNHISDEGIKFISRDFRFNNLLKNNY